jgi:hypothetical protein
MSLSISHLAQILLTSSLWTISTLITIAPAITAESKSPFIFECSRDPQTRVYSTIIKYTTGKNKELIRWKSKAIENPKVTCRNVSDRFNSAWDSGRINLFKVSQSRRTAMTIICGVPAENSICNEDNKLFELSPGNNKNVATDLLQLINDKNSNKPPIWQSSGDDITIDLRQFIE